MTLYIPVPNILLNPEQPRKTFDEDGLRGLAQSIRAVGIILPIAVEEAENGIYILIDGERRLRAAEIAGLKEIPAIVHPAPNGNKNQTRIVKALIANVQRTDLDPVEEALAYSLLLKSGLTQNKIAVLLGVTASRVHARLNLLNLEDEILDLVRSGQLLVGDPRVVRSLLNIKDPEIRIKLARKFAEQQTPARNIIAGCNRIVNTQDIKQQETPVTASDIPVITLAADSPQRGLAPGWDVLQHLNWVPAWPVVEESARRVCEDCVLRDFASTTTCKDCPAVEMLRHMLRKTEELNRIGATRISEQRQEHT